MAVAATVWASPIAVENPTPIEVGATLMLTGYGASELRRERLRLIVLEESAESVLAVRIPTS